MISLRSRASFQVALILFLITTTGVAQNTINVPADQPTIQAAINTASPGDTVLVAPGTYVENINFNGKEITVTSSGGAASTTIDGNAASTVVTFNQGETSAAVLNGFTIRNGYSTNFGGGIEIHGSSPTVSNNVITANRSQMGVGINVHGGSALIQGNTITGNTQLSGSPFGGGGVAVAGDNTQFGNPRILNNTITNNSESAAGGGIAIDYYASPLIQNNYIADNYAYGGGGGISTTSYQGPIIVQNIIVNNTSGVGGQGGGIYVRVPTTNTQQPQLVNNTLYGNSSPDGNSGIYIDAGPGSIMENNIVVVTSGNAITCSTVYNHVVGTISHNLAYSSSGQSWAGSCPSEAGTAGNLAVDPAFADPVNGDFHVQPGSAAIDAGDINIASLPPQDYAGAARLGDDSGQCNFVIDLGVYQSHSAASASLSIFPSLLSFPDQQVGTISAPQSVTLTSSGQGCFRITSFNVSGDFAQTNGCGTGLPAGQSCSVQVTFAPTATGIRSGALAVTMNTNMGPAATPVTLNGNGVVPYGTTTPSSLSFPSQNINTSSPSQTVVLTNNGGANLTVNAITVTGDFSQTNSCTSPIAPGGKCSIQVTFTPTINGQRPGKLSISSNSSPGVPDVSLVGVGVGPQGTFSPVWLQFYPQLVNTTTPPQNVTLTNVGGLPLTISGFSMSGDYAQTNNCPSTLPPNTSCLVQVTFTPTTTGFRQGWLTVASNSAPVIPGLVSNGTGTLTGAAPAVSPTTVNFGDILLGQTGSQNVTITNNGNAALTINSISASSPFNASGCVGNIDPGASCTIVISWTPQALGAVNGTLTIVSNNANPIPLIPITGRGVQPALIYSATSLTFATQKVGTPSDAQAITLSNTGTGAYSFSQFTISQPDFVQTNNCPASIAPGVSCTINLVFAPTAAGSRTATLSASGSPAGLGGSASLNGTGAWPAGTASPSSLSFPITRVSATSSALSVTLANSGPVAMTISSVATTGDFAQTNTCGASLAAGQNCTISVTFSPTQTGSRAGQLTIADDSQGGGSQVISLGGSGQAAATVSPSSLAFPLTRVNTTSSALSATLSNLGSAALNISSISTSGDFAQTNTCGVSLAAGQSCAIAITFSPTQTGARTGQLTIADDLPSGGTQVVSLSGNGGAPVATTSATSLSFAITKVATTSGPDTMSLSNNGLIALSISSITISGDFSQTNNCPASLAPSATCSFTIYFTPTQTGTRTGHITINDDAQGSPQVVSLTGTAGVPSASVSPSSLSFPTTPTGSQSSASIVTLSNSGPVPMSISSILTNGDFVQVTNNCNGIVSAGSYCSIYVALAPTQSGTRTGQLVINDDSPGSPQVVALSGSATDFSLAVSPTSVSINPGQNANYNVKVSAVGGAYNQAVSLACSGLPAGANCTLTPASMTPGSTSQTAKMKVTTSSTGTPAGTYTVGVTGMVNNVVRSGTATLIIK